MDDRLPDAYAVHTVNLLRLAAGHRAKALTALLELESTLVGKVSTAPTLNKKARVEALIEQVTGTITSAYEGIAEGHATDLGELAAIEQIATTRILSQTIGADIASVAFSANQLEAIVEETTFSAIPAATGGRRRTTPSSGSFPA